MALSTLNIEAEELLREGTQKYAVYNYIKKHGSITQQEATKIGILRLAAVIYDLNKLGIKTSVDMIQVPSRYIHKTTKVAKYFFTEDAK